jgi:cardiolipin synthase
MLWLAGAILFFPLLGLVMQLAALRHRDPGVAGQLENTASPVPAEGGPTLCLGGPEFMAALAVDLASAQDRALIQTLSFEGDAAGQALAEALIASPAAEKCLIIDSYSRLVQSDMLVGSPLRLFNIGLYREKSRMNKLVERMQAHGVEVVFGRPYGFGRSSLVARDHKKMCVMDDVTYVGGINFSDHNFLWRDLMLRAEDPAAAQALAEDFNQTRQGRSVDSRSTFASWDLVIGRGSTTHLILDDMTAAIAQARREIYVECPYITQPLLGLLGEARRRGVEVTIVTSEHINRFGMKWSIQGACADHDLTLRLWPDTMTHVKAMLIDGDELLLGSANFDFLSGTLQPELMVTVRDPNVIAEFDRRIRQTSLARSYDWSAQGEKPALAGVGRWAMGTAESILTAVHGGR